MKKKNSEKISVVVACYNVEKFVKECIESLKSQTYSNIEVLLIDDGSKDGTKNIIKSVISGDPRFQYYYQKNSGVSSARNLGLKYATGEYITFLDSDDYVEPTFLEKLYQSIQTNNSDFAICSIKRVYPKKNTYHHIQEEDVYLAKLPAMWNKLCRIELLKKNNIFFPENIWYEDLAVGTEVFLSAKKFSIVDEFLHNYRQQEGSLIRRSDNRIFDIYKTIEIIEDYAQKKKIQKKYHYNLEFINIYHILIGTTYRASFHECFSKDMVEAICQRVEKKYPNWFKNPYLEKLGFPYRVYLFLLAKRKYRLCYTLLKYFSKYLYL